MSPHRPLVEEARGAERRLRATANPPLVARQEPPRQGSAETSLASQADGLTAQLVRLDPMRSTEATRFLGPRSIHLHAVPSPMDRRRLHFHCRRHRLHGRQQATLKRKVPPPPHGTSGRFRVGLWAPCRTPPRPSRDRRMAATPDRRMTCVANDHMRPRSGGKLRANACRRHQKRSKTSQIGSMPGLN